MKAFSWDCPKCGHRTTVKLADGDGADLICAQCGWTMGQDIEGFPIDRAEMMPRPRRPNPN
jgi:transcription elongation factor Elf1